VFIMLEGVRDWLDVAIHSTLTSLGLDPSCGILFNMYFGIVILLVILRSINISLVGFLMYAITWLKGAEHCTTFFFYEYLFHVGYSYPLLR
jgi:hypothetical protein